MSGQGTSQIIGIGASAGGLESITKLFEGIPTTTGHTFVIIQHLSPNHKSLMPELLARHTKMTIYKAENNQKLLPNCIYLNQPENNLQVKDNRLLFLDRVPNQSLNLPIDNFFHSLGEELRERSIGVILSGTGSDGSKGIKSIKNFGGAVFVQSPDTAQFDGMPNASIATGLADFIMSPEELATSITNFPEIEVDQQTFQQILKELQKLKGVDFTRYKSPTLLRRLAKRVKTHQAASLKAYFKIFQSDVLEKERLWNDFLIGVTSFFRDQQAYNLLTEQIFPRLCQGREMDHPIRIWVPACSTGEEAYSIAMLLDNYLKNSGTDIDFKIFASDISEQSLIAAGLGLFDAGTVEGIEQTFQEHYFEKQDKKLKIIKRIRDKIIFAKNNIINDPPFIEMDFISCRNLLIYLNKESQQAVTGNFKFSLKPNGVLFLGPSESLGGYENDFVPIDAKWKIFKIRNPVKRDVNTPIVASAKASAETRPFSGFVHSKLSETTFYKYISDQYGPSLIFLDQDHSIHFLKGDIGMQLNPKEGLFQRDLMRMVDPPFAMMVRQSIAQLEKNGDPVVVKDVKVTLRAGTPVYDLTVSSVLLPNKNVQKLYLLEFVEKSVSETDEAHFDELVFDGSTSQRISDLEQELQIKDGELRNLMEELDTSNEELQSSNEELMSANEELQSTNEELQSVNEELYTVNTELQQKNFELLGVYNDLNNLYASQEIATMFLDSDLKIRHFTPSISKHFKLNDTDVGRPLSNFMFFDHEIRQVLIEEVNKCLKEGVRFETSIMDQQRHYLLRVYPFMDERVVSGVIITLIDVNDLTNTQKDLSEANTRLNLSLDLEEMATWEWNLETDVMMNFNEYWKQVYEMEPRNFRAQLEKRLLKEEGETSLDSIMEGLLAGKQYTYSFGIWNRKLSAIKWIRNSAKVIEWNEEGTPIRVLGISKDITEEKRNENDLLNDLLKAKEQAEYANMQKDLFLSNLSHEIRTPMNAVVGFAKLLRRSNLKKDEKELYLEQVEENSKQLLVLINDILDLTKIESGELKLQPERTDLKKLMNEIYKYYSNELKKNEQLSVVLKEPKNAQSQLNVCLDPVRLRQVLNNLVDNAIKYSMKGVISLSYQTVRDRIKIEIKDQGKGIAEKDLPRVFERFEQLAESELKTSGAGLGLAICKGIINAMGGAITAHSEVGQGSTFVVSVPLVEAKEPEKPDENQKQPVKSRGLGLHKILIADDSPSIQLYYRSLLRDIGVELIMAENGEEAVKLFKKFREIKLILMDLKMPKMSGEEAFEEIRKLDKEIPVIAQSAFAMNDEVQRFKKVGFTDYITKPIDEEKLKDLINKHAQTL